MNQYDTEEVFTVSGDDSGVNHHGSVRTRRIKELEDAFMALEAEKTRIENQAGMNDHFFFGMANEIQAPVGQAIALAELLLTESPDQKPRDIASDIRETLCKVLLTVNDMLDLSKIRSGELTLKERHYDFITMLKGVRSAAYFQAKEKKLRFDFRVDPSLPRCLFGDPDGLRRILSNIIDNAVKFTERGQVSVDVSRDGDSIRVNVLDTGVGMNAEDIETLFNPYSRPYGGATGKKSGSGLGMAISKRLLMMMGGSIIVDSVPGAGSRIHLHLPLRPGNPDAVGSADGYGEGASGRRRLILVVDDNEKNLLHAGRALEAMGYECDTAASGRAALEKVLARDYDLVLMDCGMPVMNGADAAQAIRRLGKTDLPIVGLAAVSEEEDGACRPGSEMNDILAKPVRERDLRRMLEKWLSGYGANYDANAEKEATSIMPAPVFKGSGGCGVVEMAENIEGLDIGAGLAMVSGQYGMYEELLQLAAETLPGLIDNLVQAIRDRDAPGLRVEINGLGESLHTLGMLSLSEQARGCEALLEKDDVESCADRLSSFVRNLRIFVNQLQGLFENSSTSSSALYGDATVLEGRLHKILHEMALGNHVEVRKLASAVARRTYGNMPRGPLMEIRRLVNAGEYKSARDRIGAVLKELR